MNRTFSKIPVNSFWQFTGMRSCNIQAVARQMQMTHLLLLCYFTKYDVIYSVWYYRTSKNMMYGHESNQYTDQYAELFQ